MPYTFDDLRVHFGVFHSTNISRIPRKKVVVAGHKEEGKTVSYSVIEKIACLLRSALTQAQRWEYISSNPADAAVVPKAPVKRRDVYKSGPR